MPVSPIRLVGLVEVEVLPMVTVHLDNIGMVLIVLPLLLPHLAIVPAVIGGMVIAASHPDHHAHILPEVAEEMELGLITQAVAVRHPLLHREEDPLTQAGQDHHAPLHQLAVVLIVIGIPLPVPAAAALHPHTPREDREEVLPALTHPEAVRVLDHGTIGDHAVAGLQQAEVIQELVLLDRPPVATHLVAAAPINGLIMDHAPVGIPDLRPPLPQPQHQEVLDPRRVPVLQDITG